MADAGATALLRHLTAAGAANGLVALIFAATGPVAIILAAADKGGLGEREIASWLFGAFCLNGVLSIGFSLHTRQPLVFLWTMPGTVLVGQALTHMTLPEAVGAFIATGLLMLALGAAGLVQRAMALVPAPVVMAMVAGVFLQFGLDWVRAFAQDLWIAASMTVVYLALLAYPAAARALPPMIATLAVGIGAAWWSGALPSVQPLSLALSPPLLIMPVLSWRALVELVLPLAITVLVVQNGQGIGVLGLAGHKPPVDAIAAACGAGSIAAAFVGAVPTCLAGPVSAILATNEARERQYMGGVVMGLLCIAFGVFAPIFTRISLAAPKALIAALAGLAMLKILQAAFTAAFQGRFALSALITFLITVAGQSILGIGAPFWGIVFGALAARLIEREA